MQAHPLSSSAAWNPPTSPSAPPPVAGGPGLAHDAGNLLGALGLYCDLLDAPGVLRPQHLHYARELRLLAQRSSQLIHRLLEGGAVEPHTLARPARMCPAQVTRELLPLLRSLAAPDACVRSQVPRSLPPLPFASEIFERVLVNLTRNAATAFRAGAAGSRGAPLIRIALALVGENIPKDSGPRLLLTVADNAGGMAPDVAARFVKPLPLPAGARCGLGHRIVHELLAETGGELSIHVALGRSTRIEIAWPLAQQAARNGDGAC